MTQFDDGHIQLPPAVRRKITEGKQAFDAQFSPAATEAPPAPVAAAPEAAPPPPSSAEGEGDPPQVQEPETPQTPITEPPSDQPPPTGDDLLAGLQEELRQANHRFASLQGRYRADMDRQARQLADAQRQLTEMMGQLTSLAGQVAANKGSEPSDKKPLTKSRILANITDAERAEFGEGFFDMLARVAEWVVEQEVSSRLGQIPTAVENLTTRLDQSYQRYQLTKQERREQWLDANLPGWREQDADRGFMHWLEQEDAFSGVVRMQILSHAMARDDYNRIKQIFEGYVAELGTVVPSTSPRQKAPARARLQAQAMPNGGNGRVDAIVPNAPEAPPTPEEIQRYYDRKVRNRKSLTDAEIAHMEGRIARALAARTIQGVQRV